MSSDQRSPAALAHENQPPRNSSPAAGCASATKAFLLTPFTQSGRRLSKLVLRADSNGVGEQSAGLVELEDESGSVQLVRVDQYVEIESDSLLSNMVRVSWEWTADGNSHQVELRHGRHSGIRKLYVNQVLEERTKGLKRMLSDTGSYHVLQVGGHQCEVFVSSRTYEGFEYELCIDGNRIEQIFGDPTGVQALDVGSRLMKITKEADGLGMTLRENQRGPGFIVWSVESGLAASKAGLNVGDVVLSLAGELPENIEELVALVSAAIGSIDMEVAGRSISTPVTLYRDGSHGKLGLTLLPTSCGIGFVVVDIDSRGAAAQSDLRLGDIVLSMNSQVPTNCREAIKIFAKSAEQQVHLVIAGR